MNLQLLKKLRNPLSAAAVAALLAASTARADAPAGKLTLSGYGDVAAGQALMAGHYDAVIEQLAPGAGNTAATDDAVAASTNLCVAYVAAGKLDAAHSACDEAIRLARQDRFAATLSERLAHQDELTIAYANRAVLSKLAGQ